MPRPLPPGSEVRRRQVGLRLSAVEEAAVQVVADDHHAGVLSAAIRALTADGLRY